MNTQAAITLATYILDASKAHDESYDKEASDKETNRVEAWNKAQPVGQHHYVDYAKFQKLNIFQATAKVVPVGFQMPVYLLLTSNWNDAREWALSTLKDNGIPYTE